ncbi:hypothetical protein B0J13DRAFT_618268 [Dactylonectria estremocensis]|uniref:GAT domain-containing protein n=1 Tax=Dactylonectria estremocensis TaxID=1079267 RepID=A0A9P9FD94_9HYPO|nr:hypothetical protein B0J13DRAFT_618268 [Dactylonectria estremocensis]
MKSMKGLSVNKVFGSIRKKASNVSARSSDGVSGTTPASTPEITAHNSVKAFCESGGKAQSDEVLFLPPIVDAAECSPSAAAECARIIRKYMSRDFTSRPSWQYNAIMLMRILTDNPGATFTRNFDQKFVDTTRQLLKGARDPSVRQILMETLDDFEHTKMDDENLALLVSMWKKEKEKAFKDHPVRAPTMPQQLPPGPGGFNPHSQNYFARSHSNKRLPDPVELASRLEEARTSAKLLEQVVMNTPPTEMLENDLIKEFADRCQSASRSIQGYMTSENPTPDNETMENLIDTNELLQTALNQHKRAVLNSRKHLGLGQRNDDAGVSTPLSNGSGGYERREEYQISPVSHEPPLPDRYSPTGNGKGKETDNYAPPPGPPPGVGASGSGLRPQPDISAKNSFEDPFQDPRPGGSTSLAGPSSNGDSDDRLAYEPFHPGFGTTQSYLNRQDSAADKVAMHGAATSGTPVRRPARDDVSDDDDLYDAPPRAKEPPHHY